jgi:hypothetical protein
MVAITVAALSGIGALHKQGVETQFLSGIDTQASV